MKRTTLLAAVLLLIISLLAGCAGQNGASSDAVSSDPAISSDTPDPSNAPEDSSSEEEALGTDDLEPIYGSQIQDGTYPIEVKSSSSMFKIVDCQLTVADGEMSAVITLSGTGYEKLYLGTGAEAEADSDEKCIYFVENPEGAYTYEVPVEALDMEIDCAAWSIRKEQWYDRVVVFQSELIPADAITK